MKENKQNLNQVKKAKAYNRLKRWMALLEFFLAALFLTVILNFGWTMNIRNLAVCIGGGPVVDILVYFLILAIIFEVISFPLVYYGGYLIETRFGLLHQSTRKWLLDLLKSQLLGLFLGILAVETLYLFIRLMDWWWWLPAGAIFALFFVVLAQLMPVVILPLFFKFKKMPKNDLTDRLSDLCRKTGTRVVGIYEWGLSAKSSRANAALMGWGPTRRVVLSDSLLDHFTGSEVEVVLAHELGHHSLKHIRVLLAVQGIMTFIAFLAAGLVFDRLGAFFGLRRLNDIAGLPLMLLSFMIIWFLATPILNGISRNLERKADRFAISVTGLTGSFISAIERLTVMNLSEMDPPPIIEFLLYSHPSPARRIREAKKYRHTPKLETGGLKT